MSKRSERDEYLRGFGLGYEAGRKAKMEEMLEMFLRMFDLDARYELKEPTD